MEKLNPVQPYLSNEGKTTVSSDASKTYSHQACYEQLEIVNRAVNMIVDDVAAIKTSVGDPLGIESYPGIRKKTLERLLNKAPNPFQDISSFKRALVLDLILEGNIFVYFDGAYLYQLPSTKVTVVSDPKFYVKSYNFEDGTEFSPNEVIHIKDNSFKSIYRGSSRLEPALRNMNLILKMRKFQENFFNNGAVPGLVIKSPNTLNDRLKKRLLQDWENRYRPGGGGRKPLLLDGGLDIDTISNVSFKELDFQAAITSCEEAVLKALGVPPILLDTGNNANIRPNHRLFYLETIIPIVDKINAAFERFFGFEIYEDITYIEALRPELTEQSQYYTGLVNGGVITPNEARVELGRQPLSGLDEVRVPANIAGSAADPSQGGRPPEKDPNGK